MAPMRRAVTVGVFGALSVPAVAHASDMSGLVVIVAGMFLGVPAALLLIVSIVVSVVAYARPPASWHRPYATATYVFAPLLGLAYPLSLLLSSSKSDFVILAFIFDVPALVLALVAVVLARRLARRAR